MNSSAFLLLLLAAPTLDVDANALFQRVQAAYKNQGDLSARFTQTHEQKLLGKKKIENGRLWAKPDGRVRWSYEKPARKDFIYDGKAAYFYEPENAQVTVFEKFQDSPLWSSLRFLWGQGSLKDTFDVHGCDQSCGPPPWDGKIRLVPKTPLAALEFVVLSVDLKTNRMQRALVTDAQGNRTEYLFEAVELGAKVDAKKFEFAIPQGVQVLRAAEK